MMSSDGGGGDTACVWEGVVCLACLGKDARGSRRPGRSLPESSLAPLGLFTEAPVADYSRTMEVNYLGTVRTIKLVLPDMLARQQGHIVIVSSALAVCGTLGRTRIALCMRWQLRSTLARSNRCNRPFFCSLAGFSGYASYAPSKWALRGLADCLRNEVRCW